MISFGCYNLCIIIQYIGIINVHICMRWMYNFNIIVLFLLLITTLKRIVYVHWVVVEFNLKKKLWWIWITLVCAWDLSYSHLTSMFIDVNRHDVMYKLHQNNKKIKSQVEVLGLFPKFCRCMPWYNVMENPLIDLCLKGSFLIQTIPYLCMST